MKVSRCPVRAWADATPPCVGATSRWSGDTRRDHSPDAVVALLSGATRDVSWVSPASRDIQTTEVAS